MARSPTIRFTAATMPKPTRLDRVLRDQFPSWGRQAVQRLIGSGKVRLNGRVVKLASWEVQSGDRLEIAEAPPEKTPTPVQWDESWVLFEDDELIALNKPAGLLSEAPRFRAAPNLLDLARERFGPVILFHRLDRDTSGVILLTRPGDINKYLTAAFQSHTVHKEYLAVVATPNDLAASGSIEARLGPHPDRRDQMTVVPRGGQRAVTRYAIADERDGKQLIRLHPETGRTHQLRVHLAHSGAPIMGDRLYGPQPPQHSRLLLHAEQIHLPEAAGYFARSFIAPLPTEFWPVNSHPPRR